MTEEEFWHTNPRKLNVYEKAWKDEQEYQNEMMYLFWGNYGLSALFTAIDNVLNGKKAKAKYIDEPIKLFEMTDKEKELEKENAIARFMGWAKATKNNIKKGKEVK